MIEGVDYLERGYENFSTKLEKIGAAILIKKKFKIMFKLNDYLTKISLKDNYKKYISAFAFSFFIGFFIASIPYIYKFIENFRNQILTF